MSPKEGFKLFLDSNQRRRAYISLDLRVPVVQKTAPFGHEQWNLHILHMYFTIEPGRLKRFHVNFGSISAAEPLVKDIVGAVPQVSPSPVLVRADRHHA